MKHGTALRRKQISWLGRTGWCITTKFDGNFFEGELITITLLTFLNSGDNGGWQSSQSGGNNFDHVAWAVGLA